MHSSERVDSKQSEEMPFGMTVDEFEDSKVVKQVQNSWIFPSSANQSHDEEAKNSDLVSQENGANEGESNVWL